MPPILESDPLDSWDVEEEPVSTPDDDVSKNDIRVMFFCEKIIFIESLYLQELGDLEDAEDGAIKLAKKKMPKVEESKSKKEHVNVVFIGHVGE